MPLLNLLRSCLIGVMAAAVAIGSHSLNPQVASASTCTLNALSGPTNAGTSGNPYLITSAADLGQISATACGLDKSYRLTQNIGPVTAPTAPAANFIGEFDGAGYTVSLAISGSSGELALFGKVTCPAKFRNLVLIGSVSAGASVNYTASLFSYGENLAGDPCSRITVENVHSSVAVDYLGGGYSGGLVGFATEATDISRSSFTGTLTSNSRFVETGSIAGRMSGSITDSYGKATMANATTLDGDARFGGLLGYTSSGGVTISKSYSSSTVRVNSTTNGGGIAGGFFGPITASAVFWNSEIGPPTAFDDPVINLSNALGRSSARLTDIATYQSAGWAITSGWEPYVANTKVWGICSGVNDGFPFLLSEYSSDPCPLASTDSSGSSEGRALSPAIHLDLKAKVGDQISGRPVEIAGTGLGSGSAYSLVVRSSPTTIKSGSASGMGNFSNTLRMPALPAGTHTLTLTAIAPDGSALTLTQTFTVSAAGVVTSMSDPIGKVGRTLAETGSNPQSMIKGFGVAIALLLLGVLVGVFRQRMEILEN